MDLIRPQIKTGMNYWPQIPKNKWYARHTLQFVPAKNLAPKVKTKFSSTYRDVPIAHTEEYSTDVDPTSNTAVSKKAIEKASSVNSKKKFGAREMAIGALILTIILGS